MSPTEEAECWADRTPENRWRLARHHLPLIMKCAREASPRLANCAGGRDATYDAYMETALDLLWRATAPGKYDPAVGPFGTYVAGFVKRVSPRLLAAESEEASMRDRTRRRKLGCPTGSAVPLESLLGLLSPDAPPSEGYREMVRLAIGEACEDRERGILHYVYWRGMNVAAASRMVGISRELGRRALARARMRLHRLALSGRLFLYK